MSVDLFLKLKNIKGEAQDKDHRDEIDIVNLSWGLEAGSSIPGVEIGHARVQNLSVTKCVDQATPNLIMCCFQNTLIDEAVLTARKAGKATLEYFKITLKKVRVASVSTGPKDGERIMETVNLRFEQIKIEYTPQRADGGKGATNEIEWNVVDNV